MAQYLVFLDGQNPTSLWKFDATTGAINTAVSFSPYAGNTGVTILPAIATVSQPQPTGGADPGVLLFGNDSAGNSNLFFWDGVSAPTELSNMPGAYGTNPQLVVSA